MQWAGPGPPASRPLFLNAGRHRPARGGVVRLGRARRAVRVRHRAPAGLTASRLGFQLYRPPTHPAGRFPWGPVGVRARHHLGRPPLTRPASWPCGPERGCSRPRSALNFSHGLNLSPRAGVVMALVSSPACWPISSSPPGPAGPARTAPGPHRRAVARRELAVRRAAVRDADAVLDGTAARTCLSARRGHPYPPPRPPPDTTPPPVRIRPEPRTDEDPRPYGPYGPRSGHRRQCQRPRPGAAASAGRAAFVAELAEQIRDAIDAGDRWAPDYDALMERSGFGRSWCEKAVRDARTAAFRTAVRAPARTASPDEPARTGRPVLHAVEGTGT